MGFNSGFKGLNAVCLLIILTFSYFLIHLYFSEAAGYKMLVKLCTGAVLFHVKIILTNC